MFPSSRHHRFSTALLEVAEAMLRPVPAADEAAAVDDAWDWPARDTGTTAVAHPHRRPARIERRRRPGVPMPSPHPCTTAVPARPSRDPRAPSQLA